MLHTSSHGQQLLILLGFLAAGLCQDQKADSIRACLDQGGVQATISTDATWAKDTAAFQFRIAPEPVAVALPQDKSQVATALSCARNASVKVSAVGRAHSFQGYGYGNPGNLVIDMQAFTGLSFDNATNQLTFGGGANVGPAAKYLWDNHRRHFPHVRGSHVGLAGSTMGGGFGTTSRFLGIPTDNLASVEFMLHNGSIVTGGPGSDLHWAAQGAGPSFGIVLSATLNTHAIPIDGAVSYSLTLGDVDVDIASAALLKIQQWVTSGQAPDELSLRFQLGTFASAGFFYGVESDFDRAFAPLVESVRSVAPAVNLTKTVLPSFWDAEVAAVGPGMNDAAGGQLGGRAFFVQSWTVTNDHALSQKQAKALLQSYHSLNRTDLIGSGFLDLWGGISRDIADADTAFAHGKNLWLIRVDGQLVSGIWPSDGNTHMQALMKPFESALKKSAPLRSFVNYVNSELSVKEWSSRLYGSKNFAKLRKMKAAFDPEGMFSGYGLAIPAK
ncbi:FAD-binding domain-containing protein [Paraphaeosphaeria sporulosa]|uniref:FAD-binding domain-containing protein n=1 Tax=Paraphaeosphaeria sporulosa TaxID=1460663 RepID=A0A177CB92_9PLEO|nr:FAD-binding domain-containing protein [Paraphaeosphaeria sporulosa]OAG04119.1 FAD-binding domain-containing protein [Paraphaeosphaeria sporulosa]